MRSSTSLLFVLALTWLLPACHRDVETSVIGSARFDLGADSNTGFVFARETVLPNDATATKIGSIAGHCALGRDAVDVRLETIGGAPAGVAWMDVHVVGTAPDDVATVEALVNGKMYTADCALTTLADRTGGTFRMSGVCPLLSTAPDTVTLSAELDFDACDRE